MLRQLRYTTLYALLTLSLLALGSCVTDGREIPAPEPTRMLLAYIGVDNNLAGFEQEKMDGLRAGWTGRKTDRIFAYVDNRTYGANLYELSVPVGSEPHLLASYGPEDSASAETFSRVIVDVLNCCDADRCGLLIFSHASGWLPSGALTDPESVAATGSHSIIIDGAFQHTEIAGNETLSKSQQQRDTRSIIIDGASEMELTDFAAAIPDGVFDYIVFESCFMAGIEVAYELRRKADYILASSAEIVHPGFTYIYDSATANLINSDIKGFGQKAFDNVKTYSEDNLNRSATYSAIRTAGLDDLAEFVRDNCDFDALIDVADIQHFDRYAYRLFFDFEDYCGRLLPNESKRAELAELIGECVIWKAATPGFMNQQTGYNGFAINKHSGLTTYIPQEQFAGLNEAYAGLAWTKAIRNANINKL